MDSKRLPTFSSILLIISSILCFQSRADGTGSVYFIDSSTHSYFQSRSSESKLMSLPEVGAAVSILLGFAPPSTLSSSSSAKLTEVLMANPFDRPHAVFFLEIMGFGDMQPELSSRSNIFSKALKSEVTIGNAEIQFSDEDDLILASLNEPHSEHMTDKDLIDFASWLAGSYVNTAAEPLSGELTIPLANDVQLKLHMSKEADRKFITSIISLINNIGSGTEVPDCIPGDMPPTPAELIKGRFDGFKAFQEHYGTDDIVQKGAELLVTSVSKMYNLLQASKGRIVGVFVFSDSPAKESDMMLTLNFTKQASPRWLEEKQGSHDAALIAEVLLVRRTLAWITGIILIIATLMGVWFLMYMPLTRDTLLYSNVKLD